MSLDILRSFCFVPAKIENWIVLLDAQDFESVDLKKVKISETLKK